MALFEHFYVLHLFIIIALKAGIISGTDLKPPVVEIGNGKIEGTWKSSLEGRLYRAFEGVPYAQPPIGELRFREPRAREPWLGTWKAVKQYACPQVKFAEASEPIGEEDCLYLDVFVPKIEGKRKLDVLVHIHGGAFYAGNSGSYIDPRHLMDRDWIVVSLNYRLGALGFLSTEDDIVPGNNGLKDQSLALKWIQENIASFGGNPDSVTLTGFSAGAASTHLHYFAPWSKGLFHRGWTFSGTSFNSWAIVEKPLKKAQKLSKVLGCDFGNNREMVDCLRQQPASLIVKKSFENMHQFPPAPYCPFGPVIEKSFFNQFLQDQPFRLLENGKALDVPWITSMNVQDALFIPAAFADRFDVLEEKWTEVAKYFLDYDQTFSANEKTIAEKIREFYLSKTGKFDWEHFDQLVKMVTDRYFEVDCVAALQQQSKVNKSPVYFSKFTYEGTNGWKQSYGIDYDKGTVHGDDMVYYFGGLVTKPMNEEELELKNICLDTLYSYASTGIPVSKGVEWTPVGKDVVYLNITGPNIIQMEVKTDFSANKFWKSLNLLENENIFVTKDEL